MSEITPITREEKLWNGEDLEPLTREEMYIKRIFDKTQTIPDKPLTRKEILMEKAGEGGGGDVTIKQLSVTANGTYSEEGTAYSPVNVNVPLPENAYLLKTASGSLVSFNDGTDLPMPSFICNIDAVQDLHGYDGPWVGGAGKNKLPMTIDGILSNNGGSSAWTNNARVINDITFTILTDSNNNVIGIKVNGTASANTYLIFANNETSLQNNEYIITGGTSDLGIVVRQFASDGSVLNTWSSNANPISFTLTRQSGDYLSEYIYIASGKSFANVIITPMVRLATATDPTFDPYENICPISGHTDVDAWVRGKNLFDKTSITQNYRVITLNGELEYSSGACASDYTSVTPNTTYTMNFVYYSATNFGMAYYDANKVYISGEKQRTQEGNTSFTFTTPSNCKYIRFTIGSDVSIDNVQLEKGSTATTYEPYNPQSQTIQVSWQTEAGEVYGGYVDLVSGVLVVDRKTVIFDGSSDENISAYSTSSYRYRLWISEYRAVAESVLDTKLICSKLKTYTKNDLASNSSILYGLSPSDISSAYIIVKVNGITNLADFKTWLSQNELQVIYPLATPITYQLTPHQIKSLLSNNNAWCSTGDVDIDYFAKEV